MNIKILGRDCADSTMLVKRAAKAAEQLHIDAAVEFVDDPEYIWSYGIVKPPVLLIDDKIVTQGEVPTIQMLKTLILLRTEERSGHAAERAT